MNAVTRQRRTNARRIAQATAATAAVVVLSGGVAQASTSTDLRARPGSGSRAENGRPGSARPDLAVRAATALPSAAAVLSLPVTAADRLDAVSGVTATVDLLSGELPTDRALVALTATPAHGRVVLYDDATAGYTSTPGYTGPDSFGYRFTDERGRTSRVTVAVTVSHGTVPADRYAAPAHAA
ncbi:Ig-like domain-containing protein [Streptacidiphilus cavernicola]|uniref:Ig-like domain-containing protein n=1 Tax=Streptacidiphilus cavernicola TaxID=3342716 RepID=A0ABV6VT40_9ACTN